MKELKIEIPKGYEIDKKNSTFEKIVFKPLESKYPKTWEECVKKLNNTISKYYRINSYSEISNVHSPIECSNVTHYNLLPSKEIAEKFLVLQKLYTCRQAYIGNWKPDWSDYNEKYNIVLDCTNSLQILILYSIARKFSFPTSEMAQEFLNNFKSDLEFVKDLL